MQNKKEIKKRLSVELSGRKHKEIKLAATEMGLSIKEFVDESIQEKITNELKKLNDKV